MSIPPVSSTNSHNQPCLHNNEEMCDVCMAEAYLLYEEEALVAEALRLDREEANYYRRLEDEQLQQEQHRTDHGSDY
jgi:hypothetical protein